MKKHEMKLQDAPFEAIRDGRKTVEMRLYDEKRQTIEVGDEIEFRRNADTGERIRCKVIALHLFPSFEVLYQTLPLTACGYAEDELAHASYTDMEHYYPKEEQAKWGVVGIEICCF